MTRVKYNYNRNYFHIIDTPQKAYWVGFIVGDGYLRIDNRKCYSLRFCLSRKDTQLLYNLIDDIGGSKEQVKEYHNYKDYVYLPICSKQIVQDLIKLGVPAKNKSFTATVPNIPDEFMSAFYLGLFDADGSVGVYREKWPIFSVTLTGRKNICESFSNFLGYEGKYVNKNRDTYRFVKSGNTIKNKIYNKLYKYNIPCLERKKKIFKEWLNAEKTH